jgi:hypothetical protein
MKGTIKIAALAALLTTGAAFAQGQYPDPATQPQNPQTPATTPSEPADSSATTPTDSSTTATDNEWPDFGTLDANGDGKISQDEAKSQSLIASRFSEIDGDKDGSLSTDEYQKAQKLSKAPNP